MGIGASNPLNIKGAENHFSAPIPLPEMGSFVREQIEAQKHQPNQYASPRQMAANARFGSREATSAMIVGGVSTSCSC